MLDIENFIKKIKAKSRLMGVDPGKTRIGISISDENRILATPLKTLVKKDFSIFLRDINLTIKENQIGGIVIGNPINMDGSKGPSSQSATDLSYNLSKNISVPITMWDERLSSSGTFKIMRELEVNSSKKLEALDKNAAAFILQGFLDFINK